MLDELLRQLITTAKIEWITKIPHFILEIAYMNTGSQLVALLNAQDYC